MVRLKYSNLGFQMSATFSTTDGRFRDADYSEGRRPDHRRNFLPQIVRQKSGRFGGETFFLVKDETLELYDNDFRYYQYELL